MKKRRILWFILWLLSLAAITIYGGVIGYTWFFGALLMPVISASYLLYVYIRFLVYQKIDTRNIVCGQSVPYYFILQNNDFTVYAGVQVKLFSDFSFVENIPDQTVYRIYPGEKYRFDTRLTCKYRGEYDVGVSEISLSDFFGLFRLTYRMPSVIHALVVPKIVPLSDLKSLRNSNLSAEQLFEYEKTEPDVLVRSYIEGDPPKRIHWKATAVSGEIKTRLYTGSAKKRMLIFTDFERIQEKDAVRIPLESKLLECVIALLYYFASHHSQTQLVWLGRELCSRNVAYLESFDQAYHELSALSFQEKRSFDLLLQECERARIKQEDGIIFWVVHELSELLMHKAEDMTQSGNMLIVYVVTDADISAYYKQINTRLHLIRVGVEQNVEEVL